MSWFGAELRQGGRVSRSRRPEVSWAGSGLNWGGAKRCNAIQSSPVQRDGCRLVWTNAGEPVDGDRG